MESGDRSVIDSKGDENTAVEAEIRREEEKRGKWMREPTCGAVGLGSPFGCYPVPPSDFFPKSENIPIWYSLQSPSGGRYTHMNVCSYVHMFNRYIYRWRIFYILICSHIHMFSRPAENIHYMRICSYKPIK